ncbi:MAG: hypothetical protein B7Y36_18300 [Novosphingobium sp. 28-62-57]|uniref:hypothetical protein n=1 Tax=unclassified Novosphingobium TaxID=2644732 RepID=UPI000BC93942|nr:MULTISPECIES: hypothetical protein [unclassified Novosphingobium]OYW47320.1 MAG: hypothetical protein B7Z36_03910 [Novosphingobium sp. 12-63-9]OYZ07988.1 MAG: hypothetical protein B7Y36_18300 [Novosphingobium sp. 28-62-57]HQS69256.1 hypothetical protein [Novosphingobium sp.]
MTGRGINLGNVVSFADARAEAMGLRIWQGIETFDPPNRVHDHADLLAMAERMLAVREKRFPALVTAGKMSADQTEAELATFRAIVADWRFICTGEGEAAPLGSLMQRADALDASLRTIADIARDEGGFSDALADQAECVIALRWHLEPGRRTAALAQLSREIRAKSRSANSPTDQAHNHQEANHAV